MKYEKLINSELEGKLRSPIRRNFEAEDKTLNDVFQDIQCMINFFKLAFILLSLLQNETVI